MDFTEEDRALMRLNQAVRRYAEALHESEEEARLAKKEVQKLLRNHEIVDWAREAAKQKIAKLAAEAGLETWSSESDTERVYTLAQIQEVLARKSYPEIYAAAIAKPDYDPEWWSHSDTTQTPFYAKGVKLTSLTQKQVWYNDVMYKYAEQHYQSNLNTARRNQPKRFTYINLRRYPAESADLPELFNTETREVVSTTSRRMRPLETRKIMSAEGPEAFRNIDPTITRDAQSLSIANIRATFTPEQLSTMPAFANLDLQSEGNIFRGATKIKVVRFLEDVDSFKNYAANVKKTLFSFRKLLKSEEDAQGKDFYFIVHAKYYRTGVNRQEISLPIFMGYLDDVASYKDIQLSISDGQSFQEHLDAVREVYADGVTSNYEGLDDDSLTMDLQTIKIFRHELIQRGGSMTEKLRREMEKTRHTSHSYSKYILSWCHLRDYKLEPTKRSACFAKILSEVYKQDIKDKKVAHKGEHFTFKNYNQLWNTLLPQSYGNKLSTEDADIMATLLGYKLKVYNAEGEPIYIGGNCSITKPFPSLFGDDSGLFSMKAHNALMTEHIIIKDAPIMEPEAQDFAEIVHPGMSLRNNDIYMNRFKTPEQLEIENRRISPNLYYLVKDEMPGLSPAYDYEKDRKRALRVVLLDDHYMLITRFTQAFDEINKCPEVEAIESPGTEIIPVYYDLETRYIDEGGQERTLRPYSIAWKIAGGKPHFFVTDDPKGDVFEPMFEYLRNRIRPRGHAPAKPSSSTIVTKPFESSPQSVDTKRKIKVVKRVRVNYIFIAYNGSAFDHHLLFEYFVKRQYIIVQPPRTSGKLTSLKVLEDTCDHLDYISYTVWDPRRFVPGSLDYAAKAFGVECSKYSFDHEEVQKAHSTGVFKQWLKENKERLEAYNMQDIVVLELLCDKAIAALSSATGKTANEVLSSPSIPAFVYKYWQKGFNDGVKIKAAPDHATDKIIRKAVVAGRVEARPGRYGSKGSRGLMMVDVVSIYPTVMKENLFPVGDIVPITSFDEAVERFNRDELGVFSVYYDQRGMEGTSHTILPDRKEDGRYNWVKCEGKGLVPTVTLNRLLNSGCDVTPIPLSDWLPGAPEIYGYVWTEAAPVFKEFVEITEKDKNEQDKFKATGDKRYNNALREMYKLILNSLSGKVIQKNRPAQSAFFQKEPDYRAKIKALIDSDTVHNISPITENAVFVEWKDEKAAYKNPHPSQLGVFIYAYAREYMTANLFSRVEVIYSDTDSGVISCEDYEKLPEELLTMGMESILSGVLCKSRDKKFGDLEVEEIPAGSGLITFDEILVIAPKCYAIYRDGKIVKYTMKGVGKKDMFLVPADIPVKMEGPHWQGLVRAVSPSETWLQVDAHKEIFFDLMAIRLEDGLADYTVTTKSFQIRGTIREGKVVYNPIYKQV